MSEANNRLSSGGTGPRWIVPVAVVAVILGGLGTLTGLAVKDLRQETWWMLLVNFLFWTGLAQGMLIWSAIFRTAQATWTPAINRIGRAGVGFLPFSLLLFFLLLLGCSYWLTWLHNPVPEKAAWLNGPFFFLRNFLGLMAMAGLSYLFLRRYQEGEAAEGEGPKQEAHHRVNALAVGLIILYAVIYSLLAFDLVMSLEPHWFSTLFGGYFFIGNLYLALAGLIILAILLRGPLGWTPWLGPRQFRDLGNLLLGFGLLTTGLFFAQYLTIWYENLPEETTYIIPRFYGYPWKMVGWVLLAACYLGPFILLLSPVVKSNPRLLGAVAGLVFVAVWIERWALVVPTLAPDRLAGLGLWQWAIPVLCAGVFTLVVVWSLQRNPGVSSLDLELELSEGVTL